ncbi:hypothetical protein SAY86_020829 [Trapa natans]|uniref:Rhamnogalacturonan endolyase n=1 Tax=Trapa natans TaxID=22666 RepID=A0AAN7REB8_TRANT|nr:hypothetical protein SAY86_020829 [Trapa natans]
MMTEVENWPYSFPASEDFYKSHQRGNVSGRLLLHDRYVNYSYIPAEGAYIGLAPPGDVGSWQRECKGYQFWTQSDEQGMFCIKNIRPGDYNLYAWVPGFIGDYHNDSIIAISPDHLDRSNAYKLRVAIASATLAELQCEHPRDYAGGRGKHPVPDSTEVSASASLLLQAFSMLIWFHSLLGCASLCQHFRTKGNDEGMFAPLWEENNTNKGSRNQTRGKQEETLVGIVSASPLSILHLLRNPFGVVKNSPNLGVASKRYWDAVWSAAGTTGTKGVLDRLEGTKLEVVVQNEEQVELSFTRTWNFSLYETVVPMNVDKRFVLLRGSSGFYTYAIYEHLSEWPGFIIDNTRTVFKLRKDNFPASKDFTPADQRGKVCGRLLVLDRDISFGQGQKRMVSSLYQMSVLVTTISMRGFQTDNGTYAGTTWQIRFTLDAVDANETYTLQVALATAHVSEVQIRLNNPDEDPPLFTTGVIGKDNTIARHGIHGLHWYYTVSVPGTALSFGENTIFLRQAMSISPFQGVMYDYIRFEAPSYSRPNHKL